MLCNSKLIISDLKEVGVKYESWLRLDLHTKIQNFRIKNEKCKLLNSTAIESGYAGRDPQRGTSDGSFLLSSLSGYNIWLKFFFSSLKEKGKN